MEVSGDGRQAHWAQKLVDLLCDEWLGGVSKLGAEHIIRSLPGCGEMPRAFERLERGGVDSSEDRTCSIFDVVLSRDGDRFSGGVLPRNLKLSICLLPFH